MCVGGGEGMYCIFMWVVFFVYLYVCVCGGGGGVCVCVCVFVGEWVCTCVPL